MAFGAKSSPVWTGTTQNTMPPGSRSTVKWLCSAPTAAPQSEQASDFGGDVVGFDVKVDAGWSPLTGALREQLQCAQRTEQGVVGIVVLRLGVVPDGTRPEPLGVVVRIARVIQQHNANTASMHPPQHQRVHAHIPPPDAWPRRAVLPDGW